MVDAAFHNELITSECIQLVFKPSKLAIATFSLAYKCSIRHLGGWAGKAPIASLYSKWACFYAERRHCFVWKLAVGQNQQRWDNSVEITRLSPSSGLLSVHSPTLVIPHIPLWDGRNEPPCLPSPGLHRLQLLPERSHQSENAGFCCASVGWEPGTQPWETAASGPGQREFAAGSTQEWVSGRPGV